MIAYHEPVLLGEVMGFWLNDNPGIYVDCTTGGGGHSEAMLGNLQPGSMLHCLDRDHNAIEFAKQRLQPSAGVGLTFHHVPFSDLNLCIAPSSANGILYDLGVSSRQLDDRSRGFSFASDVPLDLRMDNRNSESAQEWLRRIDAEELSRVLHFNADLDRSRSLARRILDNVLQVEGLIMPEHIRTAVERTYPDKRRDVPGLLARVFQAIRMEINGEIEEIRQSLRYAVQSLKTGGRLCVISYHSVEDRAVKTTMAEFEQACICPVKSPICQCGGKFRIVEKMVRKPIVPTDQEIHANSRARSAKLRVYSRL